MNNRHNRSLLLIVNCLLFIVFLCPFKTLNYHKPSGVHTVVIDAGHGGFDAGCGYGGVKEKNITLSIALRLGKIIKEKNKDVKVIFTRDDDTFVELWERAGIANRNAADVFISIHCNANPHKNIDGTETYTMGMHKSDDNLEVAKRENSVILMEENHDKNYGGFDPNSPEADIIFSLYQDAYIEQSLRLASHIEHELGTNKRTSRGIKQAGFVVLWKTAMPSVLVETGFLSNQAERSYLNSAKGQDAIASSIYRAFHQFKEEMED